MYLNIETLPLDRFILCITEGDLKHLIHAGQATDEELAQAWSDIFIEYLEASGDNTTRYRITLNKDIAILTARLSQIESLLFLLQTIRVQEAVELLQAKGNEDLEFTADPARLEDYFADLELARSRSREVKIDLELKTIERDELLESEAKARETGAARRADKATFLNILARIATFKGVAVIRTSEITVAEFCAMFTEYLDNINAVKLSNQQTRKKWNL